MITVVLALAAFTVATGAGIAASGPEGRVFATTVGFFGQYQNSIRPVSRAKIPAISPGNDGGIGFGFAWENGLSLQQNLGVERQLDRPIQRAAAQYQSAEPPDEERRLMLGIGLGLGLAYIVFLGCWLWATRLRSRPRRH